MKIRRLIGLSILLVGVCLRIGFGQSATITTYAGGALPIGGALATTQSLDAVSAIPDGLGGLFVASSRGRIFRVAMDGTLTFFAGAGTLGFSGDGGPAITAQFRSARAMAVDASGSLFIADTDNHRIRRIGPTGIISTIAGNGTPGFNGDGGPAIQAQLNAPEGIAVDATGNLFIADTRSNRIRKVGASGVITTIAGNGAAGFSGENRAATLSQLGSPQGITIDTTGSLFVADRDNHRVRKIDSAGMISTVAGNGTAGFTGDDGPAISGQLDAPRGVAVDGMGNLFVADANYGIRKINSAGVISTVAGQGNQEWQRGAFVEVSGELIFRGAKGVAVDASGNLFITSDSIVRRLSPAGGRLSIIAGNGGGGFSGDGGPATSALLRFPAGVAVDAAGNLFISDRNNNRIRKVTPSGVISTIAGNGIPGFSGDSGPAVSAQISRPEGIAVDPAGNLFFSDCNNGRIRRISANGIITTVAGNGATDSGPAVRAGDGGLALAATLEYPEAIAVDASGNLYFVDGSSLVRKVTAAGIISTVVGSRPGGGNNLIFRTTTIPTTTQLQPGSLAIDRSGNLFITDVSSSRIIKVTPDGTLSDVVGTTNLTGNSAGDLNNPWGIAIDKAGNLFIGDQGNRIRKVTPDGIISTAAGNGTTGSSGDGGSAVSADFKAPGGITVDERGNLFIADSGNHRIRKVAP